jgi:hypothetical protein
MSKKDTTNRRNKQILSLYAQGEKPALQQEPVFLPIKKVVKQPKIVERPLLNTDLIRSLLLSVLIVLVQIVLYFVVEKK